MDWLKKNLPKIVVAPSFAVLLWFVYGFIAWTFYVSLTKSKLLPNYEFWGIHQYIRLWQMPRWHIAVENLFIFKILFIIFVNLLSRLNIQKKSIKNLTQFKLYISNIISCFIIY